MTSLLAEVSHDKAKMRERRESLFPFSDSFLPRREKPLLAENQVTGGMIKGFFGFEFFHFGIVLGRLILAGTFLGSLI